MKISKVYFCILVFFVLLTVFSAFQLLFSGEENVLEKHQYKPAQVQILQGDEYPDVIKSLIKGSTKRIYLSMYVARYENDRSYALVNQLFALLVEKFRKGVDVKVVLDASREWNPKEQRLSGPISKKNEEAFVYLKKNGVPVVYDSLEQTMHAKSLVIDDHVVVIGSTNWTYSALVKNVEYSSVMYSREINREMSESFTELWQASKIGLKCP